MPKAKPKPKPKIGAEPVAKAAAKPIAKAPVKAAAAGTGSKMWIWILLILIAVAVVIVVVVAILLIPAGTAPDGTWRAQRCPYQGTYGECSYDGWCDSGETPSNCPSDCDLSGAGKQGALEDCLELPTQEEWDGCIAAVAFIYDELPLCECVIDSFTRDICIGLVTGEISY